VVGAGTVALDSVASMLAKSTDGDVSARCSGERPRRSLADGEALCASSVRIARSSGSVESTCPAWISSYNRNNGGRPCSSGALARTHGVDETSVGSGAPSQVLFSRSTRSSSSAFTLVTALWSCTTTGLTRGPPPPPAREAPPAPPPAPGVGVSMELLAP